MKAYKPIIQNTWDGGWNRLETPCPRNAYRSGINVRLDKRHIPERRDGTSRKNTAGGCDFLATGKPGLNGMVYYPTGRTKYFVIVSDVSGGANADAFFSTDATDYTAQSQTLTAGAMPYMITFPMDSGGAVEDHLLLVNGTESLQYDPALATWAAMEGTPVSGGTHICEHGDRAWIFKNNYAYYSSIAGSALTWTIATNYLDFAHEGQSITCGISFNNDLVVYRRNSIGVLRGKDPYSGVQINAISKSAGCVAPKTLIVATYRKHPAVYGLSERGLEAFDGYTNHLVDGNIKIADLIKSGSIGDACAGLYENRYLMLSFTETAGTVNDTTIIYDTERDIFISKDIGYYPKCWFKLGGGTDKGELYFGTSKDLGMLYEFGVGTVDDDPAATSTDVNIDFTFESGEVGMDLAQDMKIRKVKCSVDTTAGARLDATLSLNDGEKTSTSIFKDTRVAHSWDDAGLIWDAILDSSGNPDAEAMIDAGYTWDGGIAKRNVFSWNVPQASSVGPSSSVKFVLSDQDETVRVHEIETLVRQRQRN